MLVVEAVLGGMVGGWPPYLLATPERMSMAEGRRVILR